MSSRSSKGHTPKTAGRKQHRAAKRARTPSTRAGGDLRGHAGDDGLPNLRADGGLANLQSSPGTDVLRRVAHSLRNPLSTILIWLAVLRHSRDDKDRSDQALDMIDRSVRRVADLATELQDLMQILTGSIRLQMERLQPASVANGAVDAFRQKAESRGITIEQMVSPGVGSVLGDPARLQQVVSALLSNAVRLTPEGGKVLIRVEGDDQQVRISVQDEGPGIRAERLSHVFDGMAALEGSGTNDGVGLGLSLAIARSIVGLHGGTLEVVSSGPGKGSTFTVSIPLRSHDDSRAPARGTRSSPSSRSPAWPSTTARRTPSKTLRG